MPRQRRLDLLGIPQHVIQRGNNRQPCFLREQNYRCYLSQLGEAALAQGCRINAYELMTNHVHLLMTPDATGAVARTVQSLGRRYVGYFNATFGAVARFGQVVTSPAWSTVSATCSRAIATSSSTRCVLRRWQPRVITHGQANAPTRRKDREIRQPPSHAPPVFVYVSKRRIFHRLISSYQIHFASPAINVVSGAADHHAGKVLIERIDTYAGPFGDEIGVEGTDP